MDRRDEVFEALDRLDAQMVRLWGVNKVKRDSATRGGSPKVRERESFLSRIAALFGGSKR